MASLALASGAAAAMLAPLEAVAALEDRSRSSSTGGSGAQVADVRPKRRVLSPVPLVPLAPGLQVSKVRATGELSMAKGWMDSSFIFRAVLVLQVMFMWRGSDGLRTRDAGVVELVELILL